MTETKAAIGVGEGSEIANSFDVRHDDGRLEFVS